LESDKKKSWIKRLLLLLLATAPILMYWALKAPAVDSFIYRKAVELAASKNVALKMGKFDFDPWGPTISVDDFSAISEDETWRASAGFFKARLVFPKSPGAGFGVEIWLEKPSVRGEVDIRTHRGLPPINLETLKISGGSLTLKLNPLDISLALPEIDVDWTKNSGAASIRNARATWKDVDENLGSLDLKLRKEFSSLRIDSLAVEGPRLRAKASGRGSLSGPLDVSLEIGANLTGLHEDLIEALRLDRFRPVGVKHLKLSGSIVGRLGQPKFNGKLKIEDAQFGPVLIDVVDAEVEAHPQQAFFHALNLNSNVGNAKNGRGKISWEKGLFLEADAEASDYSLRPFMGIFTKKHFPVGLLAWGKGGVKGPLYPELALKFHFDGGCRDLDVSMQSEEGLTTHFALASAKVIAGGIIKKHSLEFYSGKVENDSVSINVGSGRIDYLHGLEFETDVKIKNLAVARQYVPNSFDASGRARGKFGGPYGELAFHYDFDLDSSVVFGKDIGKTTGLFDYDLKTLSTRNARVQGEFGELSASGDAVLLPDGTYNLELDWKNADLGRTLEVLREYAPDLPQATGKFFLNGRLGGPLLDPEFAGTARLADAAALGVEIDGAVLRGSASAKEWTLDSSEVNAYGARATVQGKGGKHFFRLNGKVGDIHPGNFERLAGRKILLNGLFFGSFEATGGYGSPLAGFRADAADATFDGAPLGMTKLQGEFRQGKVELSLSILEETVKADGFVVASPPGEFSFDYSIADLVPAKIPLISLPAGFSLGAISGNGAASGSLATLADSKGSFSGEISKVKWKKLYLDSLIVKTGREGRNVDFDLSAKGNSVRTNGTLSLAGDQPVKINFFLESLDLSQLDVLPEGNGGFLSAKGGATISLSEFLSAEESQPMAKFAALKNLAFDGNIKEFQAGGRQLSDWIFSGKTDSDDTAVFSASGDGISLDAEITDVLAGKWEASALLDSFDLKTVSPVKGRRLEGLVSGNARIQAVGVNFVEAAASGEARDIVLAPAAPSNWSWKILWKDKRLSFDAVEPRGVNLHGSWLADGVDLAAEIKAAPIVGWIEDDRFPESLTGTITGKAEISLPSEGKPSGELDLTGLNLDYPPARLENKGNVKILYKDGVVEIEQLELVGEGVDARASGSFAPLESWDAKAEGEIDLALLRLFVPAISEAEGQGKLFAEIHGPWGKPFFEGTFQVSSSEQSPAFATFSKVDGTFDNIRMNAKFNADSGFVLDSLDAAFGLGTVHLEGAADLDGLKPVNLRFAGALRDIEYEAPAAVEYRFDADLFLSGNLESPRLRGEILLNKLLYERRTNWKSMLQEALLLRPRGTASAKKIEEKGLFIDLAVIGPEAVLMDNNLGRIPMSADLRLRGNPPDIFAWGRIDVREGSVVFRTRDFDLAPSSIEFLGDSEHVALLDLHASTTVSDYEINADITGPLFERQVNLSCNPPVGDATDIVALLFTGVSSNGGPSGEQVSSGDVTSVEAASFLLGGIQDTLETRSESLGQSLGPLSIDRFHIDPAYSAGAQTADAKITVGKEITDSLQARYSRLLFGEVDQDLELTYTLTRNLSLLGAWQDRGDQERGSFGGEIRFVVPFNRFLFFR